MSAEPHGLQAGGNVDAKDHLILTFESDVLKRCQTGGRGAVEHKFYEDLFRMRQSPGDRDDNPDVLRFFPTYKGLARLDGGRVTDTVAPGSPSPMEGGGEWYLRLTDLTKGFSSPCVADLKLGTSPWDPVSTPEKIAREDAKSKLTTSRELGVRWTGFVLKHPGGEVEKLGREWGKSVTKEGMQGAFADFLLPLAGCEGASAKVSEVFRSELRELGGWLESQCLLSTHCSSVLLVYDAAPPHTATVSFIDFGHAEWVQGDTPHDRETGMSLGIRSICAALAP